MEPSVFPRYWNFVNAGFYTRVDTFNKYYIGIQTSGSGVYQANLGKN